MSATMTASKEAKRAPVPMNGVDTPTLFATINAVGAQPELAKFQFRAKSRWVSGTRSESTMHGFFGAGAELTHIAPYTAVGDHPAVLCGTDAGPTPVEWVLHALASCLTAGIGNIAAARGIKLNRVELTVEGDIDLSGVLGLSGEVRNGYQGIKVSFEIDGDASPEKARADRHAVEGPVSRLRHRHQRCSGVDIGQDASDRLARRAARPWPGGPVQL